MAHGIMGLLSIRQVLLSKSVLRKVVRVATSSMRDFPGDGRGRGMTDTVEAVSLSVQWLTDLSPLTLMCDLSKQAMDVDITKQRD